MISLDRRLKDADAVYVRVRIKANDLGLEQGVIRLPGCRDEAEARMADFSVYEWHKETHVFELWGTRMAKGLSDLQQFLLERASKLGRVYYTDILEIYFGWRPQQCIARYPINPQAVIAGQPIDLPLKGNLGGQVMDPESNYFSPSQIGEEKYNRGMASLSHSCARLQKRGLVRLLHGMKGRWAAVEITLEGCQWVEAHQPVEQCQPRESEALTDEPEGQTLFPELGIG